LPAIFPSVRHLPTLTLLVTVLALHFVAWRWLMAVPGIRSSFAKRSLVSLAAAALVALLTGGFSLSLATVARAVPPGAWVAWTEAAALGWALFSFGGFAALWLWRLGPRFDPGRRRWLKRAAGLAVAAPAAAGGAGIIVARAGLAAREVSLRLDGLPRDLDGLRLAQLTDIHLSPFLSARELARAVDMANEFRAHLALVTGDLITGRGDPLDACLRELARLKASDGIYGCLGNHEGYTRAESYCARQGRRLGIDFLRGENRLLRFGGASMNLAGVDYQTMGGPYLVGAETLRREGCFNVLLSHNPDVFPTAARQGYSLTLSGHTHGGQLALSLFGLSLNVVRLFTPYVRGLYRRGCAAVYVSTGIGTVGLPLRIGASPEVTLIRLCAS
jgi:predicted MPP superfamily phosphohydrolase